MDNDWEKELIRELKNLLACQRSVQNLKNKRVHLLEQLHATQNAQNKSFYQHHINTLEAKLMQSRSFVSRLKRGLSILCANEREALFELYIKPSGKKKEGSQGQVYRLKNRAMQKLFLEFNGYTR